MILSLGHSVFFKKLQERCEREDKLFVNQNEAYTSKSCNSCGKIKRNLGSNKIFNCGNCKMKIDRDVNGAINILKRGLLELDSTIMNNDRSINEA